MSERFKKDIFTEEELWEKSKAGDTSILKDKNVSLLKDNDGDTPLHYLAHTGKIEVLNHPKVTKVKNNYGKPPIYDLVISKKIPKKYIQKLFPKYPLKKNEKIDAKLIIKILKSY